MAVSGSFTGTGTSAEWVASTTFTFSVAGFGSATVALQRSFDDGSTWVTVESFTDDFEGLCREVGGRNNTSVSHQKTKFTYRFNCTAYTSGTITYFAGV